MCLFEGGEGNCSTHHWGNRKPDEGDWGFGGREEEGLYRNGQDHCPAGRCVFLSQNETSWCLNTYCDLHWTGGAVLYDDIKVTMTSKQLNGSQRVLLDKVISDDECRELQRLSNVSPPTLFFCWASVSPSRLAHFLRQLLWKATAIGGALRHTRPVRRSRELLSWRLLRSVITSSFCTNMWTDQYPKNSLWMCHKWLN